MSDFATTQDIIDLKRALSADEQTRASALLPVVSDIIRVAGESVGKDIDELVAKSPEYANVVKSVTVGVVLRELDTPAGMLPATQSTESAGGLSLTYTLPNASDTIRLWPSDLKTLGLKKQRIGVLELMG